MDLQHQPVHLVAVVTFFSSPVLNLTIDVKAASDMKYTNDNPVTNMSSLIIVYSIYAVRLSDLVNFQGMQLLREDFVPLVANSFL